MLRTQARTDVVQSRPRRSPFQLLRLEALTAASYAAASLVWVAFGGGLPGGRWMAVHLFTLGVVTNLVPPFTRHFASTLTRVPQRHPVPLALLNAGILAVLVGIAYANRWTVAVGATVVTAEVLRNWWGLRRRRRRALGARFIWIVRVYERAHGAFVHGAILGALMGTGLLAGDWYLAARVAHLHVNVLGWAGLTLLATLVFFGPTVLRVRIEDEADVRASSWLQHAATGLTVAALALLLTAVGGGAGLAFRLLAAVGLAVYAGAAVTVCRSVYRAASRGVPSLSGYLIRAAVTWLPAAVIADVVVVATGNWRLLDAVGLAFLAGVLAQAIVATLGYVAPLLSGTTEGRERVRRLGDTAAAPRALAAQVGVALVVGTALGGTALGVAGAVAARVGWALVAVTLLSQLLTVLAAGFTRGKATPEPMADSRAAS